MYKVIDLDKKEPIQESTDVLILKDMVSCLRQMISDLTRRVETLEREIESLNNYVKPEQD